MIYVVWIIRDHKEELSELSAGSLYISSTNGSQGGLKQGC